MTVREKYALRSTVASAIVPCGALLVGLLISSVFPWAGPSNTVPDHVLSLARHEL